ncbi:hypothetical protein [Polymorphospora sp. NPDC050346]|uniref:hypothetical protein n=1 Tax=Polymorphospora sp. NPDC050346 TaxID=3155780 RepID=UPI0033C9DC2B
MTDNEGTTDPGPVPDLSTYPVSLRAGDAAGLDGAMSRGDSEPGGRHGPADPSLVHLVAGLLGAGRRVRAACSCGHTTTARADDARAIAALRAEHELTAPVCVLCGHDYTGQSWQQLRDVVLRIFTTPTTGEQFLACRDMPQSCRDGAAQRQMHLDRAALEGLRLPVPAPQLRVIPGGGQ